MLRGPRYAFYSSSPSVNLYSCSHRYALLAIHFLLSFFHTDLQGTVFSVSVILNYHVAPGIALCDH